jgi:hypothetical protein
MYSFCLLAASAAFFALIGFAVWWLQSGWPLFGLLLFPFMEAFKKTSKTK